MRGERAFQHLAEPGRLAGGAGSGREDDPVATVRGEPFEGGIDRLDHDVGPETAELLAEVVGERVEGVHQEHPQPAASAAASAERTPRAFDPVSSYSRAGTESATIPAPTWTDATPSRRTAVRMAIARSMVPVRSRYPTAPA